MAMRCTIWARSNQRALDPASRRRHGCCDPMRRIKKDWIYPPPWRRRCVPQRGHMPADCFQGGAGHWVIVFGEAAGVCDKDKSAYAALGAPAAQSIRQYGP